MSLFSKARDAVAARPVEGRLPGFAGAAGWLNSEALTEDDLRGKVVLADFCTYTCINWLRTLGYVRAWAERYGSQGLVVVGVHTPEFPFEADTENVVEAVKALNVEFPIALDPEYAVWEAFGNRYWPAVYIADAEGRIRHHQFGEGGYDECEHVIQELLREAGGDAAGDDLISVIPDGVEAQADWGTVGVARDVRRLPTGPQLRVSGWRHHRRDPHVFPTGSVEAQLLGPLGRLDNRGASCRLGQGGRIDRISLPRPRRQPRPALA